MYEEFESIVLKCGHSINSYKTLGVCHKCNNKCCEMCLQLIDDVLVCPKCFDGVINDGKSD